MYKTCPKCGHQRQPTDAGPNSECAACGLIFTKWLKQLVADEEAKALERELQAPVPLGTQVLQFFFPHRDEVGRLEFWIYLAVLVIFTGWGIHFITLDFHSNEIGRSFLHNVNLVFHEAGHFFFQPMGRFMMLLGGSLFQVLLPLLLAMSFLVFNRDAFGASVCLWWTGQSLMDLAPYIADARALRLPLLGGGTGVDSPGMHDWANILRNLGWLEMDQQLATLAHVVGSGILVTALVWGGIMLGLYYRDLYL